ncbi:uncharacterized protein LOC114281980 [Camellia sinensis]|uniref:uncharacterized protein LOC114281980 n=1 Tax=Camellia sinensis TaxID=4442 RepID=UPI0010357249|nr:uncharacterized protein LOC114281980 [Camellia sinensis]
MPTSSGSTVTTPSLFRHNSCHLWPVFAEVRERPAATVGRVGGSRTTQAHGRRGSRWGQRAGWPDLPTTMTCRGRAGETYQIPIAPLLADHELVGVRGLTPASIEYIGQALELSDSVMGMLQRSMDLLSVYGISAPF